MRVVARLWTVDSGASTWGVSPSSRRVLEVMEPMEARTIPFSAMCAAVMPVEARSWKKWRAVEELVNVIAAGAGTSAAKSVRIAWRAASGTMVE